MDGKRSRFKSLTDCAHSQALVLEEVLEASDSDLAEWIETMSENNKLQHHLLQREYQIRKGLDSGSLVQRCSTVADLMREASLSRQEVLELSLQDFKKLAFEILRCGLLGWHSLMEERKAGRQVVGIVEPASERPTPVVANITPLPIRLETTEPPTDDDEESEDDYKPPAIQRTTQKKRPPTPKKRASTPKKRASTPKKRASTPKKPAPPVATNTDDGNHTYNTRGVRVAVPKDEESDDDASMMSYNHSWNIATEEEQEEYKDEPMEDDDESLVVDDESMGNVAAAAEPKAEIRVPAMVTPSRSGGAQQQPSGKPKAVKRKSSAKKSKPKATGKSQHGDGTSVKQRILSKLGGLQAIGINQLGTKFLCLIVGYKNTRSKSFADAVKELRKEGLIQPSGKSSVALTEPMDENQTSSLEDMQKNLARELQSLPGGASMWKLFCLLSRGGQHAIPELMKKMNYKNPRSKGFADSFKVLRDFGLVEAKVAQLTALGLKFGQVSDDAMDIDGQEDLPPAAMPPNVATLLHRSVKDEEEQVDNNMLPGKEKEQEDVVAQASSSVGLFDTNEADEQGGRNDGSEQKPPAIREGSAYDRILKAVKKLSKIGQNPAKKSNVKLFAKYKGDAGFMKALGFVKKAGYVEVSKAGVRITALGENAMSHVDDDGGPVTNAGAQQLIVDTIEKPKMQEIFLALVDGESHSRAEIASATGYSGVTPGFQKMLSNLGGLDLVRYPSRDTVQLTDAAFPLGRGDNGTGKSEESAAAMPTATGENSVQQQRVAETVKHETMPPVNDNTPARSVGIPDNCKGKGGRSSTGTKKKPPAARGGKKKPPAAKGGSPNERLMKAVKQLSKIGQNPAKRSNVKLFAKYKGDAGFKKALCIVKKDGYIDYDSKCVWLTGLGEQATSNMEDDNDGPLTNADAQQIILETIETPKVREIFMAIADGEVHNRVGVALSAGYTGITPGFKKMLCGLAGLDLIRYPSSDTVQLTDAAFPFGRGDGPKSEE